MKKISPLLAILLLTACNGGAGPIDGQAFLSSLAGPKVPSVQDALVESAQNAEKQGDFKQAITLYQQALDKHPDDKDIMAAMGDCYRRAGDFDHAVALYDAMLAKDPKNLDAKEGKGLILIAKGDFDTPSKLFEEVYKVDPKRWKTLNGMGILFTARGLQSEAQQYFREALKYNPKSASILNNMGLSQALDRHYDAALASLTQAAALTDAGSPQRRRVDLNTALIYAIDGKLENARAIAANYYEGPALDNNMGLYAHLAQDDQLAKTYLNMAVTESKTYYAKAWENLQAIDNGEENDKDGEGKKPSEKTLEKPPEKPKHEASAAPAKTSEKAPEKTPEKAAEKPKHDTSPPFELEAPISPDPN